MTEEEDKTVMHLPLLGTEEFIITFGSQYRTMEHPTFPPAHPDGYVVIHAVDEPTARATAFGMFGDHWSMCYTRKEFMRDGVEQVERWYPLGAIADVHIGGGES